MDANKTIDQAIKAFRAGRGDEGQQLLEKVLKYQPANDAAVRLLVQIQQQTPQALVTLETLQRVAEAQPHNPLVHELIANYLIASDPPAAEQSVRTALRLNPSSAATFSLLGETLLAQQRFDESAEAFRMAVRLKPGSGFAILRLAEVLRRGGRAEEAAQLLRDTAAKSPNAPEPHHALGSLFQQLGRASEAEAEFRESIRIGPNYPSGYGSLAMLLHQMGRIDEAEQVFRDGLAAAPDHVLLHVGLAHLLVDQKRMEDAEASLRRALEINGRHIPALVSLSVLVGLQGRLTESVGIAQHAEKIAPNAAEVHTTLGHALHTIGLAEQATGALLRAWQISDSPAAGSKFLHHLNFVTNVLPQDVCNAHRSWGQRYADRVPKFQPHENDRNPDRRLKIGYVFGDDRARSRSQFLEPLFAGHDRAQVEVYCYSAVRVPDEVPQRLKSKADHWRDIATLSDRRIAELIRADGIDILVDLAGHTNHNRLGVFALRVAPVPVSYQGYPNTTGMSAIAYRLTDDQADPTGQSESLYTEKVIRLPRTAWCFQPPEPAPDVAELPAKRNGGGFTFGSFSRLAKIGRSTAELWSRALNAVPEARLVLTSPGLGEAGTQQYLRELFTRSGLQGDRLVLSAPDAAHPAHLERYAQIDCVLDCFPHHGTTTTCEAMWMGVPSITLVGNTPAARIGLSLLSGTGLEEFAAASQDQFADIATNIARDLDRLAELRRTMRDRMRASPLMDAAAYAREIEGAYRQIWREWCAGQTAG